MKKINIYSIVICVLSVCVLSAQDANSMAKAREMVQKTKSFYDQKTNYQVSVKYDLYETYSGSKTTEAYEGVMVKKGEQMYSKIHQTEVLSATNGYVKVNHDEKAMIFAKPQQEQQQTVAQLEALLQSFQKADIQEQEGIYRITFTTPPVTGIPYGKAVLEINKADFRLIKQTLYYLQQIPVTANDGKEKLTNPRLEVVFTNFSSDISAYKNNFNLSNFVIRGKQKNTAVTQFKNYQFIDTTR